MGGVPKSAEKGMRKKHDCCVWSREPSLPNPIQHKWHDSRVLFKVVVGSPRVEELYQVVQGHP